MLLFPLAESFKAARGRPQKTEFRRVLLQLMIHQIALESTHMKVESLPVIRAAAPPDQSALPPSFALPATIM
jgi:hypothetical protein